MPYRQQPLFDLVAHYLPMCFLQLISSGAFEIFFNDVPIWSKLQSGRIPAPQELFQIIENQLKFSQPLMDVNPNFVK